MLNYTAYHVHTDLSLLDSTSSFQEYVDLAVKYGQKALGFSEHGHMKGWFSKKVACDKAGIKYIPACEVYLTKQLLQLVEERDHTTGAIIKSEHKKVRDNYHTVLIAKNKAGFHELLSVMSMASDEDHMYYTPRISFDEFLKLSPNIITTSACLASPLNKLDMSDPYYEKLVKRYDYLEIQHHYDSDQVDYNRHLAYLAKKYHKPLIAGTDSHVSSDYKNECRDILLLYKGQVYEGEENFDLVYRTYEELCDAYRKQDAIPEDIWLDALENTNKMADSVESWELDLSLKYPILYGSPEKDREVFIKNVYDSLDDKLKRGIIPMEQEAGFRKAAQEEIDVFTKIGMCGFMQSMSETLRWCHENGIVSGTGRGSVTGSRTAYLTDITDVNAEQWNTVFSRFCNADRVEVGDIDTDVIDSDRPKIFEHCIEKFGSEKCARVPSYGTIQGKKAIAIISKALYRKKHPEDKNADGYDHKEEAHLKKSWEDDPELFRINHSDVEYYMDGLTGVKESQSVHPAGLVISPVTLSDNYGTFMKDGMSTLIIDMDEIHDAGLVKYDFLILRNLGIIKSTCELAGIKYPMSHEMDWEDQRVWEDMMRSPVGIFEFEKEYAFKTLKDYGAQSVEDMTLINACIRPSGASYRDKVIKHIQNMNPSDKINEILDSSLGYLVYQEQIIAFLQEACGLTGSEADSVRRGIAKKNMAMLEKWMPRIKDGYCERSDKPREIAEQEVQEFLKVIEDASAYSFGYNHALAYSMIGYYCAWLRCYYPREFITSLLNWAANDDDITNGTMLASEYGVKILPPRYGLSLDGYVLDKDSGVVAKGISSAKYINKKCGTGFYSMAHKDKPDSFTELLKINSERGYADARQMKSLIGIDFFSQFGNITELNRIYELFNEFYGAKQYKCDKIGSGIMNTIIEKYSSNLKKDGTPGAFYKFNSDFANLEFIKECERYILSLGLNDVSYKVKCENQLDVLGYIDITTGKEEDRRKLYIKDVYPLKDSFKGGVWKYKITYQSIGSGKEMSMYIFPKDYNIHKFSKGNIIEVAPLSDGGVYKVKNYWHIRKYEVIA